MPQDLWDEEILNLRCARIDITNPDALRKMAGDDPLPFIRRAQAA